MRQVDSTEQSQGIGTSIFTNVSSDKSPGIILKISFVETKNTWARDDPAIIILIAACLFGLYRYSFDIHPTDCAHAVAGLAWSFAYSYTARQALELILFMILRDYLLTGIVVATLLWCVL